MLPCAPRIVDLVIMAAKLVTFPSEAANGLAHVMQDTIASSKAPPRI